MIASLPMYDRPETRAAHDRLWALVRDNLGLANQPTPKSLTRNGALFDHWNHPELILSQTCSLPYRNELHDQVSLIASPVHDLPCPPGFYFSVIVARKDDPRQKFADFDGCSLAFNAANSQSGWAAPADMAEENSITFGQTHETGSHQASALAVFERLSDLAAIDAVTWKLMTRHDPWTQDLKALATTPHTPALPYITSKANEIAPLFEALTNAIESLSVADCETLCLYGITKIRPEAYLSLPIPPLPD